jgi:hypothetical protein
VKTPDLGDARGKQAPVQSRGQQDRAESDVAFVLLLSQITTPKSVENRQHEDRRHSAFTALNEKPVVIRINLDHSYEIALSVFQSRSRFPNRKAPLALRRAFFRARAGSRSARSIPSTHPESPTNFAAGIADAPEPPQTSNPPRKYRYQMKDQGRPPIRGPFTSER